MPAVSLRWQLVFGLALVSAVTLALTPSLTSPALLPAALLVALLAWFAHVLRQRRTELETACRKLAAGDTDVRVSTAGDADLDALSQAFNDMAAAVSARAAVLQKSEDRLRHLSELASDWYWEQDAECRFTSFSGGSFRNYPEFAQNALGKRRWESEFIRASEQEMAAHRAICEAHQAFRDFEYEVVGQPDGSRWLSISGEPVFDEHGAFAGYRGTGRDVTARKLAETAMHESDQMFASLFQLSPLPLALTDLETGLIRDVNEAWMKLFGHSHSDAVSRSLELLQLFRHDNERSAFEKLIARYGRCELVEAHLATRDGATLVCELSGRTLELGDRRHLVWCVRDITRQRQVEEQIRDLNMRLEARVAERTRELEDALTSLRRTQDELVNSEKLAALGRVVAAVAHELNTPIGNCVMVATTLDAKAHEFSALIHGGSIRRSQINDYVGGCLSGTDMLVRNLQQAHNLIHSFKQVAVDQTSDRRREFELATVLGEVADTMAPMLRKTPFRLYLDIAPGLIMNSYPGPLGQVIGNFVNNALIHGLDGMARGEMTLGACEAADADQVTLWFRDTGRGIDAEHLKQIFDPFFTTRLGQGGSGLGLNIVYNLVTRILGGSIDVDSMPGEGTTFTLTLPKVAPDGPNDRATHE